MWRRRRFSFFLLDTSARTLYPRAIYKVARCTVVCTENITHQNVLALCVCGYIVNGQRRQQRFYLYLIRRPLIAPAIDCPSVVDVVWMWQTGRIATGTAHNTLNFWIFSYRNPTDSLRKKEIGKGVRKLSGAWSIFHFVRQAKHWSAMTPSTKHSRLISFGVLMKSFLNLFFSSLSQIVSEEKRDFSFDRYIYTRIDPNWMAAGLVNVTLHTTWHIIKWGTQGATTRRRWKDFSFLSWRCIVLFFFVKNPSVVSEKIFSFVRATPLTHTEKQFNFPAPPPPSYILRQGVRESLCISGCVQHFFLDDGSSLSTRPARSFFWLANSAYKLPSSRVSWYTVGEDEPQCDESSLTLYSQTYTSSSTP